MAIDLNGIPLLAAKNPNIVLGINRLVDHWKNNHFFGKILCKLVLFM